jgi:hypothetical protein
MENIEVKTHVIKVEGMIKLCDIRLVETINK